MSREDGFTLIEALVAFAILSLVAIVAFQTYALNLRNVAAVEGRLADAEKAKEQLRAGSAFAEEMRVLEQEKVDWTRQVPQLMRSGGLETIIIAPPDSP